jgi:hypothetical protein
MVEDATHDSKHVGAKHGTRGSTVGTTSGSICAVLPPREYSTRVRVFSDDALSAVYCKGSASQLSEVIVTMGQRALVLLNIIACPCF